MHRKSEIKKQVHTLNTAKMDNTSIVIVNYRTADLVIDCLNSLAVQISDLNQIRVAMVDNKSDDGIVAGCRVRYRHESRRRFFVKSYGISILVVAALCRVIGRFSFLMRKALYFAAGSLGYCDPKWFMFDLLWGDLREILTSQMSRVSRAGQQA